MLIDNLPENVEAWRAIGGLGYVFRSDDEFATDLSSGRVPGFEAGYQHHQGR